MSHHPILDLGVLQPELVVMPMPWGRFKTLSKEAVRGELTTHSCMHLFIFSGLFLSSPTVVG